jgi:Predicted thioesterase
MPRVFTLEIAIQQSDIDIQGHVNNTRYVAWMQDVAVAHSAAQGWPMTRYVEEGAGWVVRQHTITYKRRASWAKPSPPAPGLRASPRGKAPANICSGARPTAWSWPRPKPSGCSST